MKKYKRPDDEKKGLSTWTILVFHVVKILVLLDGEW